MAIATDKGVTNEQFTEHRHRCEVRQLLRWRVRSGRDWVLVWLSGVAAKRGPAAAERLRDDAARQWEHGSRGADWDWREDVG